MKKYIPRYIRGFILPYIAGYEVWEDDKFIEWLPAKPWK